jgi:bifunctional non-homologous end joining protein LigD
VGSGLSEASIDELLAALTPLVQDEDVSVGEPMPHVGERICVAPALVVRVEYLEWTDEGRLRHPVFRGISPDKAPLDCRDAPAFEPSPDAEPGADDPPVLPPEAVAGGPEPTRSLFEPTNRDKVFWTDEGYT